MKKSSLRNFKIMEPEGEKEEVLLEILIKSVERFCYSS